MADEFVLLNQLFVNRGGYFTDCCCDDYIYWEAIPCSANRLYNATCGSDTLCSIVGREFIRTGLICAGDLNKVCECQQVDFNSWSTINSTSRSDAASISLLGNFIRATGMFGANSFNGTVFNSTTNLVYPFELLYEDYPTVESISSGINAFTTGPGAVFSFSSPGVANNAPSQGVFRDNIFTISSPGSTNISSSGSYIQFSFPGVVSPNIQFNSNPVVFAANIQSKINTISSLNGLTVESDTNNSSTPFADVNTFYFTFEDNLCGISQPPISIINKLTYNSFLSGSGYTVFTGDYGSNGWLTDNSYIKVPNKLVKCPYEDTNYVDPSGNTGLSLFDINVQCCPQKGTVLGPSQNIHKTTNYGNDTLPNLERTVGLSEGNCFSLSPYFFIFGKEGRFEDDLNYPGRTFTLANCYGVDCGTGIVPCNCYHETFIPMFHPNLSWGPFGSYYNDIEEAIHPAYTAFLNGEISGSCNPAALGQRNGCFYRPSGVIKTQGSFTETKQIDIEFRYASKENFYIGEDCVGCPTENDFTLGTINPSSASNFTILGNDGSGSIYLSYNCSGKTIGNFITDINSITTTSVSGISCNVFKFCPATNNSGLLNLSLARLNNTTSELYELWKLAGGEGVLAGGPDGYSSPTGDKYLLSGATIFASPKPFEQMLGNGTTYPTVTNSETDCDIAGKLPPPCKIQPALPKTLSSLPGSIYRHTRPFWPTMQGCVDDVFRLSKNYSANYDPEAVSIWTSGSNRNIGIEIRSSTGVLISKNFNTNKSGSGYTVVNLVNDINAWTTGWKSSPSTTYQPLTASSGTQLYPIYLDDSTWWDGTNPTPQGVGSLTNIDYSYKEPLLDKNLTEITVLPTTFECWLRRRCGWQNNPGSTSEPIKDPSYKGCIPPNSTYLNEGLINCGFDTIISENRLFTYGCLGYKCKTEWYIRAQRCSCNEMLICQAPNGITELDHPFNRETNSTLEDFSQPTVYICQDNIHPDCKIPFLIKVPYQYLTENTSYCEQATERTETYGVEYSIPPIVDTYCGFNNAYEGWCQYIDPQNLDLVSKESIPRTYPPRSLLMGRVNKPFCSTNVNIYDLPYDSCPYPKYDAIGPLIPVVPFEYIYQPDHPYFGSPCVLVDSNTGSLYELPGYIRPVIKELDVQDLCPDNAGFCGLINIDCNTRCCGCGFICNTADDGCATTGPVRVPTRTITYDYLYNQEGFPVACCNVNPGGVPGGCHTAVCITLNSIYPLCLSGTSSQSTDNSFTASYGSETIAGVVLIDGICTSANISNPCCFNQSGDSTTTYESSASCGGDYIDCCDPANICPFTTNCDFNITSPLDCSFEIPGFGIPEGCTTVNEYRPPVSVTNPGNCPFGFLFDSEENRTTTTCKFSSFDTCGTGSMLIDIDYLSQYNVIISGCGTPSFTIHDTTTVNYTVGPITSAACDFDILVANQFTSYEYITNYVPEWICGMPNFTERSSC